MNRMTSWIDGSFIYSCQEAWVSTMRSYTNGQLKWMGDQEREQQPGTNGTGFVGMPPYNLERVPLFNIPTPHLLRPLSPERMFREIILFLI